MKTRELVVSIILLSAAAAWAADNAVLPPKEAEAVQEEAVEAPPLPAPDAGEPAPAAPQEPPVPYPPLPSFPPPVSRPPVPAQPAARPSPAAGAGFLVKFNNADIYEVIHTLGRMAGINYLIDPRVRGVVNVHTQGTVRKEGALDLLFSILRVNGATAVREGDVYHIVPIAETRMEPIPMSLPGEKDDGSARNRPVMHAFFLQYIAAAEMAKVIKPFLSTGGDVTEVNRANTILVTDTAGNIEKHASLVALFDADAFRSAGVKLFPLKYLDPEEMARNLDSIFGALDFSRQGGRPAGINFVPLVRMNTLLVVSASPRTMDDVDRWIGELDREPAGTSRTVRLYRLRHGKVKDTAALLEKLFPGRAAVVPGRTTEFRPQVAEPLGKPAAPAAPRQEAKGHAPSESAFDIIPDEPTNSLIIRGSASEYAAVLEILKTIDVYPRQVLLEVLIAEVQLDDSLRLGIDWTYIRQIDEFKHTVSLTTSAAALTSGLKYVVDKTDRLTAAVRALAKDGKVSILSSPSVLSANGQKSKIQVADSVPVSSGRVTTPNATSTLVTETVEYRDVGVILAFTPYINDQGVVTLEIDQEVSEVSSTTGGALNNPTFFKRSVQTTLLASQDRSIVLGGLVRERRELTRDGIPFLYQIPLIGWIFGSRSGAVTRTELLIFITPRVIESVEDGTQLSREFEDRVEELKRRIGEAKGIKPSAPEERPKP